MSIKIMSEVFESMTLAPGERLVLLALADHADDSGRCYPSIARLRERTGMSERTVQGHIKKLSREGYIRIVPNAGQGLANLYFVSATPAESAPPQNLHPRRKQHKPPQKTTQTPAESAPKPSRTINEPSVSKTDAKPADILAEVASPQAAASFVAFRKQIRKPLTETAAGRLQSTLCKIREQGGDPDDALGLAEERGWQSIKPEWYFKEAANVQPAHNQRKLSRADAQSLALTVVGRTRRAPDPDWL